MKLVLIIVWIIIGIANLCVLEKISKLSYICMWVPFITYLICDWLQL